MSAPGFTSFSGNQLRGVAAGCIIAGVLGLLVAILMAGGGRPAWGGVLAAMIAPAWLGIGAAMFLAVHMAANATWITPYRSILAAMTMGSSASFVAFAAIGAFGGAYVYDWWLHPHFRTEGKNLWMSPLRWILTTAAIIAVWMALSARLNALIDKQKPGDDQQPAFGRWAVTALMLIIPTFTLFAWDTLLALQATFVSAMWGFYNLVAAMQAALAVLILIVLVLARNGHPRLAATHLLHDLGTWMVAGACVVTYITFAQFAIISFANLDEEVQYLVPRLNNGFGHLYALEAILRISPFLILMSQSMRTRPAAMIAASIVVLIGTSIDVAWMIIPAFSLNAMPGPLWWISHMLIMLGGAGLWLLVVAQRLARVPVAPNADPRLHPAIAAEHLH